MRLLNRHELQRLLEEKEISRNQFSLEVGVNPATLRRWLQGKVERVMYHHLDKMAEVLGCEVGDLLEDFTIEFSETDLHDFEIKDAFRSVEKSLVINFLLKPASEMARTIVENQLSQEITPFRQVRVWYWLGIMAILNGDFNSVEGCLEKMKEKSSPLKSLRSRSFYDVLLCLLRVVKGSDKTGEHLRLTLGKPLFTTEYVCLKIIKGIISRNLDKDDRARIDSILGNKTPLLLRPIFNFGLLYIDFLSGPVSQRPKVLEGMRCEAQASNGELLYYLHKLVKGHYLSSARNKTGLEYIQGARKSLEPWSILTPLVDAVEVRACRCLGDFYRAEAIMKKSIKNGTVFDQWV